MTMSVLDHPRVKVPRRTRPAGRLLKQVLLGCWAMYFAIVATSNAINLLDVLGVLHWNFLAYTTEAPFRELLMLTIGTALVVALIPDEA
jgi:UDP-N-acetylmuramyl pentapeptide phosphotransferase/UDP-N-acetylglucosamine-1-phosphate transferase